MNNIKGIALVTDGNSKRIAVTYDTINDDGIATAQNKRTNRIVMDSNVLSAINVIEEYAQSVIDKEQ